MFAINNNVGGKRCATSRLPLWHIRIGRTTFFTMSFTKERMGRRRFAGPQA